MAGESAQRTNLNYEHESTPLCVLLRTELRTFLVIPINIFHLLLTELRTFTGITVKHTEVKSIL
jgi:hypothetical protein